MVRILVEGFDAETGELRWSVHPSERLIADILCAGANCYIEAEGSPKRVLCVDVQTGRQSWFGAAAQ